VRESRTSTYGRRWTCSDCPADGERGHFAAHVRAWHPDMRNPRPYPMAASFPGDGKAAIRARRAVLRASALTKAAAACEGGKGRKR
jgi:hypothetical protein